MNQTSIIPEIQNQAPQNPKRALGRGLQAIITEQSNLTDNFHKLPEHIKAARIASAILELIDIIEAKYQPVIFHSVAAYRAASQEESTEEIARKLNELDRQRIQREKERQQPKRKWYFLYLK